MFWTCYDFGGGEPPILCQQLARKGTFFHGFSMSKNLGPVGCPKKAPRGSPMLFEALGRNIEELSLLFFFEAVKYLLAPLWLILF